MAKDKNKEKGKKDKDKKHKREKSVTLETMKKAGAKKSDKEKASATLAAKTKKGSKAPPPAPAPAHSKKEVAKAAAHAKDKEKVKSKAIEKPKAAKPATKEKAVMVKEVIIKETVEVKVEKAQKQKKCAFSGCKQWASTDDYCRLHYMMAFKATQLVEKKGAQDKIKGMIDELSDKYPDEYLEVVKEDLTSESAFKEALGELDIDSDYDIEDLADIPGFENPDS